MALRHGTGRGTRGGAHDPAAGHPPRREHLAHPRPHPTRGRGAAVRPHPRAATPRRYAAATELHGTEATLLFPVVLAEARRWGLPEPETEGLLPVAERCLEWLRTAVGAGRYLSDPHPGGPWRCETQAHAHRAALLGADLLDAYGRDGGSALRSWASEMRTAFQEDFWIEDRGGGRPAAARLPDGRIVPHLGAGSVHLLDTGLLGVGTPAPGLLDKVQTEQLARLLGGPAMDSGWGLRSLGTKEAAYNPFGHRGGAVRVHETAVAVAGLAAAGFEKEASSLLRGVLSAAETFGYRLPEMYAGEGRTEGGAPAPHPAACRPAATAAAAGVLLITTLAGIRPDAPAGTVALRPVRGAPLGETGADRPARRRSPLLHTRQQARPRHGRGGGRRAPTGSVSGCRTPRAGPVVSREARTEEQWISHRSGRRRECLSSGRRL